MSINFDFVKSVLREYSSDERNAITQIVEKECRLDGVEVTFEDEFIELAHTYKAVVRLAIGDSVSEGVVGITKSRTNTQTLVKQYSSEYRKLLKAKGIDYIEADNVAPAMPDIF